MRLTWLTPSRRLGVCREYADVLQLFFATQNASASLPNGYGQQYQLDGKVLDKSHGPVRHTL